MTVSSAGLSELLATRREAIVRYIRGIVRDGAEAEDLTQETLLRAYNKLRAALGDGCSFSEDERGVQVCEPQPPRAPAGTD